MAETNIYHLTEKDKDNNVDMIDVTTKMAETTQDEIDKKADVASLDNKVDKIEGYGLSQEDFTTTDKEKLKGLKNYDDTEIYKEINILKEENTYQNKLIDGLLESQDTETKTGDNLTFDDCMQAPINFKIRGKELKQEVRQGYNLSPYNDFNVSAASSYYEFLAEAGNYTLTFYKERIQGATISNVALYTFKDIKFLDKDKNTISTIDNAVIINLRNDTSKSSKIIFNFEAPENTAFIAVEFSNNNGDNNINTKVTELMLLKGSYTVETILPYEQYGAMPSSEFESPLQYVEGNQEVEHANKNLIEDVFEGYNLGANGKFDDLSEFNMNIAKVIKGQSYIISGDTTTVVLGYFDEKPTLMSTTYDNSRIVFDTNVYTFTALKSGYIAFRSSANDVNVQLEVGDTTTDYIEHQSETINLTNLPDMYSENDYIYEKNGKWFVHNVCFKELFTQISGTNALPATGYHRLFFNLNHNAKASDRNINLNVAKCNMYKLLENGGTADKNNVGFTITANNELIVIDGKYNNTLQEYSTINELINAYNAFLSENPIEIAYTLATPTDTGITDKVLIEQLNKLKKILTYEGTNHFIVTNEQGQAMNLEVTVYKNSIKIMQKQNENMQKEIDNLKALVLENEVQS